MKKLSLILVLFGLSSCQDIANELGVGGLIPPKPEDKLTVTIPVALERQQFFHFESKTWMDVPPQLLRLKVDANLVGDSATTSADVPVQSTSQAQAQLLLKAGTYHFVVTERSGGIVAQAQFTATVVDRQVIQTKTRALITALEVDVNATIKAGGDEIGSVVIRNSVFRIPVENPSAKFKLEVEGPGTAIEVAGGAGFRVSANHDAVAGEKIRITVKAVGFDGASPNALSQTIELTVVE